MASAPLQSKTTQYMYDIRTASHTVNPLVNVVLSVFDPYVTGVAKLRRPCNDLRALRLRTAWFRPSANRRDAIAQPGEKATGN